jgi:hypothetical protein
MARKNRTFVVSLLFILGCLSSAGCLAKFPYMSKTPADEQVEVEQDGEGPATAREADRKLADRPEDKGKQAQEDKKRDSAKQMQPEPKPEEKTAKTKPEDEAGRVRTAALELAKSLGSIKKAKVCYANKEKEWWAIFYQDIEAAVDVRQFFWNADTEKFEPFLVLKRIPLAKIDSDFKKEEPGKTCSEVPLPAPGPNQ